MTNQKPVVIRTQVEKKARYSDYRENLRFDFWYSCAYCSMTEDEACGIGFKIDHYLPRKHHPELSEEYQNLMWSCQKCNSLKGDYDPDESDKENGFVIIRPDYENPGCHFELKYNRLRSKTKTGEFNIVYLALNRKQLRKLRDIRRRFYASAEYIKEGVRAVASVKADRIDKKKRALFEKMRKKITERNKMLDDPESVSSILRVFGKSELIDKYPDKERHLRARRSFLKQQKAITVQKL